MSLKKAVLDTNILIYSLDKDSVYYETIITILSKSDFQFFITSKSVSEFAAALSKMKISSSIILDSLKGIIKKYKLLYPSSKSIKILTDLIRKYSPVKNKIYDFEIISIILANKLSTIITANTKDFINISEIELFPINSDKYLT